MVNIDIFIYMLTKRKEMGKGLKEKKKNENFRYILYKQSEEQ